MLNFQWRLLTESYAFAVSAINFRPVDYEINPSIRHRIRFTRTAFKKSNRLLADLLEYRSQSKVLVFIDDGVARRFPEMERQIEGYLHTVHDIQLRGIVVQSGGEICKQNINTLQTAWDVIEKSGIDRHSYIFCIGGGAYLDVIGLAAATAHRGIRFIRFPSTTLSQDDSGVGVKNGINAYGKKNFLGTFSVPYAVVNDFSLLNGQPEIERRAGLIEAVKVALVKDGSFFRWIEANVTELSALRSVTLETAVKRSALLHAEHIACGGDPFETGSSRPLDFGHWSAHKLEQLTDFALSHANAVAVGVALDTVYSWKTDRIDKESVIRVLNVIHGLKLPIWHDALTFINSDGARLVFFGLEEFREHIGGDLAVMLLSGLGKGEEVNTMDLGLLDKSLEWLAEFSPSES